MLDITKMAKAAGLCKGPWSNVPNERIWQENRDYPDALELYTSMVIEQCIAIIKAEADRQSREQILTNLLGLNQAIFSLQDLNKEVLKSVDLNTYVVYDTNIK